jgi:ketosteroid isomerase-like protein
MLRTLLLALLVLAAPAAAKSPKAALNELLAADRAFSAASAKADPIAGITAMFDNQVAMPLPGKGILVGKAAVTDSFKASPAFKEGHVSWTPVRGGISADGTQGFTFGFLSVGSGDEAKRNRKYLAYWIKRPAGWRVVAYRQIPREAGAVSTAMMAPALPNFTAKPKTDPTTLVLHNKSLADAEKAFSDRAQIVGLRTAFRENGRDDAMNMYNGAGFTIGRDAIAAGFKEEGPAKIHWSTQRSFVASSGDLGVSIGTIYPNEPGADGKQQPGFPFFTIWKRDTPNGPWRYIAE